MSAFRHANNTVSAHGAVAVTPNNSTVIPITRALWVGGTGNISVRMADGQTVLFSNVPVGVLPIQVDQVHANSPGTTTATLIVALY